MFPIFDPVPFLIFAAMRIIASILSMYILLLASVPTLGAVGMLPQVNCCLDVCEEEDHQEGKEEDACHDICNPFLSCSCCLGFTMPLVKTTPPYLTDPYPTQNSWIVSRVSTPFLFPIWHPPRG